MHLADFLYTLAFCIFLYGASKAFRENGSRSSTWILVSGISLDFLVTLMGLLDVPGIQLEQEGFNNYIFAGITLGTFIYILFIAIPMISALRPSP